MHCVSLHTFDPSAWFPHPSALPMRRIFAPTGEFGIFGLFGVLLMVLRVFAVVLVRFQLLYTFLHVADTSATFPELSISFRHQGPAPIGKLEGFCLFEDVLMTSGIFAVIFASIQLLCTCVHPLNASARFLGFLNSYGHIVRLLAGKFNFLQPF